MTESLPTLVGTPLYVSNDRARRTALFRVLITMENLVAPRPPGRPLTKGPRTMTPSGKIGRWFYPALYFVLLFFSVVLWLDASGAAFPRLGAGPMEDAPAEVAMLVPAVQAARYATARSRHKRGGGSADWVAGTLRTYLSLLGRECVGRNESELLECLPSKKVSGHLERLASLRGGELSLLHGYRRLSAGLFGLAELSSNDPLSRKIFAARLNGHRDRREFTEGRALANSPGPLAGFEVSLAQARFLARTGDLGLSKRAYFQAASAAGSRYRLRIALRELRRDFPDLFRSSGPHSRDLLLFSPVLSRADVLELRSLPAAEVIASTNPERADGDAYFLLRTFQGRHVPALAEKLYTYLSQNPDVLYRWLAQLGHDHNEEAMSALFGKFPHLRKAHSGIWRLYISHLARKGQQRARFRETVNYLALNHADYALYDELMKRLIGPNAGSRAWASEADWKYAMKTIPARTTKGRLVYWYYQYLLSQNRAAEAREVRDTFYALAPGSYYAHAFWDLHRETGDDRDFREGWDRVRNRADYMKWISRYGGNEAALQFLATRRPSRYLDPDAVSLWDAVRNVRFAVPQPIYDLYRLGEFGLAQEFFTDAFVGRVSDVEILARYAEIGRRTGILYLSVFYTRQLTRARNVPEDPFSMPAGLLKTLYPRPYLETARRYGRERGMDPNMIYALMRQESMFKEEAVSRSNARGLMQVMPATGRWLAGRLRLRDYDLHKPDTSIRFGSMFFSDMLRENGGDFRWAALAYNGGPGNLRRWKRRYYRGDLNQFLEFIPVAESRDYCRITFRNYEHYRVTYALYP